MRFFALLFSLFAAVGCGAGKSAALLSGDYSLTARSDGAQIELARGKQLLATFAADAFQVGTVPALDPDKNYDPYQAEPEGILDDPDTHIPDGLIWETADSFRISSATASTIVIALAFHGGAHSDVTLTLDAEGRFSATWIPSLMPVPIAFMRLVAHVGKTEAFYGLGEWGDQLDHRGRRRSMQLEASLMMENGTDENHVPIPFLTSTNGWGLFVESRRPGMFDVGKRVSDVVEATFGTAEESSLGLKFHLFAADTPLDVTKHYYEVTGLPILPAEWALGPWMWRDSTAGQAQMLDDLDKLRDLDLASSGIWFDNPYQTAVNTFDWDPQKFPTPATIIQKAHDLGFHVAVWSTPYLGTPTGALRMQADADGYFPPKKGLALNGWSWPIDFTNSDAYAFWQTLIKHFSDAGVEGFKLDYGEDIVTGLLGGSSGWLFANGESERTMHYGFTLKYHQVYAEMLPQTGGYLLCRTGRWGDQTRVSVIWPGDLDSTFTQKGDPVPDPDKMIAHGVGGFPASVMDGLSLGASGFPLFAADSGGYIHAPATKELWVRWIEQTALSTVMNVGDSASNMPWEFTASSNHDQSSLDIYRTFARLHVRLFPYEWTYVQKLADDGRPITRALGLAYPELGINPNDIYLFGDNLLVAPVLTEGATTRDLTFPTGKWLDWWDGTIYTSSATVQAPLEKLPLFIRAGSIVPLLRPTIDSMAATTAPDRVDSFVTKAGPLWVRIAPGGDNSFTVYDGTTIAVTGTTIQSTEGNIFSGGMVLELIATAQPSGAVMVDGAALAQKSTLADLASPGSLWTSDTGGTLYISLGAGAHSITLPTQ